MQHHLSVVLVCLAAARAMGHGDHPEWANPSMCPTMGNASLACRLSTIPKANFTFYDPNHPKNPVPWHYLFSVCGGVPDFAKDADPSLHCPSAGRISTGFAAQQPRVVPARGCPATFDFYNKGKGWQWTEKYGSVWATFHDSHNPPQIADRSMHIVISCGDTVELQPEKFDAWMNPNASACLNAPNKTCIQWGVWLKSKVVCRDYVCPRCLDDGKASEGEGPLAVFGIVALAMIPVLLVVYLAGGMLYNKLVRNKQGMDLLPYPINKARRGARQAEDNLEESVYSVAH